MSKPSQRTPGGFTHAGFAVLRTPLLPFSALVELPRDVEAARARLRELLARPDVREALFVASPDLEASLPEWERDPGTERGAKVERSVLRYLGRMAARPTPFGLFAGYTITAVGRACALELPPRERWQRFTRLDMDLVCELVAALEAEPDLRRRLRWRPNSSLFAVGPRWRALRLDLHQGRRSYTLVAADRSPYLDATLERARAGATLEALAAELAREAEVSPEEAHAFLDELIDAQLLVSDLGPRITGEPAARALRDALRAHPGQAARVKVLDTVLAALDDIDAGGVRGTAPARYHAVMESLAPLPVKPRPNTTFQVDLAKPSAAALSERAIELVAEGVRTLARVTAPVGAGPLAQFAEAFERRYEGREVPLLEALDEELGVGFEVTGGPASSGTPALAALPFPPGPGEGAHRGGPRHQLLLQKLLDTPRGAELVLGEADLAVLEASGQPALPDSFTAWACLVARSAADLDAGRARAVVTLAGGPSGANFFGRFCEHDEHLTARVRALLAAEEALDPDAIFAEVVHFPEGRVGNVLARPVLRRHEVPFLGLGGASEADQVPASDLLVSVRQGEVVLRSRARGKRVVPRLTTAHNFASPKNPGVYRFLCALQNQGSRAVKWSWGSFETALHLPRVVVGRTVVSLARWNLGAAQLSRLQGGAPRERFEAMQALRRELALPRFVAEVESDNAAPIDLDSPLMVDAFCAYAAKRSALRLDELYPGPDELCVTGPDGAYRHEVLVPFTRLGEATRIPVREAPATSARSFLPGSEWLYAKLYCGEATADDVLREVVAPLVREARGEGLADGWFFLRYADSDHHVRVRLHGRATLAGALLPRLEARLAPLRADGRVWKVQLDTYEREVERYGGAVGVELAERFFTLDSDLALALLPHFDGPTAADLRWRVALRAVSELLGVLGFDAAARKRLARRWRDGFAKEFRADKPFEAALAAQYRGERTAIDALLAHDGAGDDALARCVRLVLDARPALSAWAGDVRAASARGALSAPLEELAFSYAHMHVNRVVRSAPRAHELLIWDFLDRALGSRLARGA